MDGILETVCVIVNTILCCTLFQKHEIAEDIECIKVDEKIHIDKTKELVKDQEYSDNNLTKLIIVPLYACNQASIQESNGESSKESSEEVTSINNIKTSCNQQHQNSDKESQIAIVINKHCSGFLFKLEPYKHNVSSRIDIQAPSNVTSSTQKNLQSNCSTGNSTTSTLYIPCPKQQIQISKNKTCPLTSTKINSKRVKLHKRFARLFYGCFK